MNDFSAYSNTELDTAYKSLEKEAMRFHQYMIEIANEKMRRIRKASPVAMTPIFTLQEIEEAKSMVESMK